MSKENSFRPQTIDELIGQPRVQKQLRVYIKASKMKNEPLEHVLITGPSSSGKTTTAGIIANELGADFKVYSGPAIDSTDDMAEILLGIKEGDVIFIDEVHRLNKKIQEMLFFALENFQADISTDGAPTRIDIPKFTCVASTNLYGSLVDAFINRFPIQLKLEPYDNASMAQIVEQSAEHDKVELPAGGAQMIAMASRGVPRNANAYLRRVSDYALVMNDGKITKEVIEDTFDMMGVNKYGLNIDDMNYLSFLASTTKAVGLETIAMSTGLDSKIIEQKIEPYLLQNRYVYKTPRGRMASEDGRAIVRECH